MRKPLCGRHFSINLFSATSKSLGLISILRKEAATLEEEYSIALAKYQFECLMTYRFIKSTSCTTQKHINYTFLLVMSPQISVPFEVGSRSFFHSCVKHLCSCVSVKERLCCFLELAACQRYKSKIEYSRSSASLN